MQRFGRGNGGGGFSALLRKAKGHIDKPLTGARTPGSHPEMGGSMQRKPNDKATERHMDAKDKHGTHAGRRGSGARDKGNRSPVMDPEHRIARGPVGTSGRVIHHKPVKKQKHEVPAHISVGPHRSGKSSHKLSTSGKTKMSKEVSERPGVPAHISVINRGPRPTGGYKHSHSRSRDLAHSISY